MLKVTERDGAVTFDVIVQPRASRERVGPVVGERLKVAVSAPPVEGEANARVCEVLARALGIRRVAVEILRGETGRRKTVRIEGVTPAQILGLSS